MMGVLKDFFKHKTTIHDVLSSLDSFSNDVKSLNIFRSNALSYFGTNWKFNLEMYISSLSNTDRAKYYELFKNVLDYEKALNIWTSAMQIVNSSKSVSADILKNMSEYKLYLLKFGIEGKRLYEKLATQLGIPEKDDEKITPPVARDVVKENKSSEIIEKEKVEPETTAVATTIQKGTDIKPTTITNEMVKDKTEEPVQNTDDEEDEKEPVDDDIDNPANNEYRQKLRQKILQKVHDIELLNNKNNNTAPSKKTVEPVDKKEKEEVQKPAEPSDEEGKTVAQKPDVDSVKVSKPAPKVSKTVDTPSTQPHNDDTQNSDWDIQNFKRIEIFLSNSREIMSAICLYKNVPSLEEYKYYGFIIDTIDYLIERGNKILSEKSDDVLDMAFDGGRQGLKNIIASYEGQKTDEIVLPEPGEESHHQTDES